jgi:serine/threonine protein phosphatase PrpC
MEDTHVLQVAGAFVHGAVFDGHSGAEVADLASRLYPELVALGPEGAIRELHQRSRGLHGGACAVTFALSGDELRVANVGDAELVLVRGDGEVEVVTEPHRIDNRSERLRLRRAGAIVHPPYVIDPVTGDGLMPTRSVGDHDFADAGIICDPHLWEGRFEAGWLIAACDGLWDVLAPRELPAFLDGSAADVAHRLCREALEVRGAWDNVTVLVVRKTV